MEQPQLVTVSGSRGMLIFTDPQWQVVEIMAAGAGSSRFRQDR
jgi:hypothetical protein